MAESKAENNDFSPPTLPEKYVFKDKDTLEHINRRTSKEFYDQIYETYLENHSEYVPKVPYADSYIHKGQMDPVEHDSEQKRVGFGR